jgi:hypothetical protein
MVELRSQSSGEATVHWRDSKPSPPAAADQRKWCRGIPLKSQLSSLAGEHRAQPCKISLLRIFNNMARFVFSFVLGSFFPQERIFNNFLASFLGSFLAINVAFC